MLCIHASNRKEIGAMKTCWIIGLCVCLVAVVCRSMPEAAAIEPTRIDLRRRLVRVDIERPTWSRALHFLSARLGFSIFLEINTLDYRSESLLHGKTESEAAAFVMQRGVHLRNVTVEEAIQSLLKDHPDYRYEIVGGSLLHVYPEGIQRRADWPLNTRVEKFAIEQEEISADWYRKKFEAFVDPMRIDLGNVAGSAFGACLSRRVFSKIALREILIELSKTCRVDWVFEPLPPEELNLRIASWGAGFYPQGKKIQARGGDWYQLHCFPTSEDIIADGVLR